MLFGVRYFVMDIMVTFLTGRQLLLTIGPRGFRDSRGNLVALPRRIAAGTGERA